MDIKKFFDQTVREVKREVNKKVLKVPEIEQKVYEATSNEPWGPHGTLMGDIAGATRNFNEYQMIMSILWKRLNDTGKNWRHVYKSLTVLEYLVANGAERIIDELREHAYQVQTLVDFQYMEPNGKDQGVNVRKKAQTLVGLLNDKDKIREVRNKAASNRDKYRGVSSNGSFTKQSSYSGSGGSYGYDRDEEDRYGGSYGGSSSRGGRDDDRYGDRDKEDRYKDDRYRDDDRSTRDSSSGDRYRDDRDRDRFEDDRYGSKGYRDDKERDRYEDDRYGSKGGNGYGNDKYGDDKYGSSDSTNKERERDRDSRSFEEDERYPPRRQSGNGSRTEEFTPDDREPTALAAAVARAHTSQEKLSATSSNASQLGERKAAPAVAAPPTLMSAGSVGGSYFASQPVPSADDFDDFDPRGSFSAADSAPANPAAVPSLPSVKGSTTGIEDLFGTSSFETSFVANPAPVSNNPIQANGMNGMQGEDMFGSSTFNVAPPPEMAAPAPTYFPHAPPPANNAANGSFSTYPVSINEPNTSFGSGSFMEASSTSIPPQSSFLAPPPPPAASTYSSSNSFQPQPGSIQAPNYPYPSGFTSQGQGQFGQFSVGGNSYGLDSNGAPPQAQAPVPSYVPPPQHQKPPQPKSFQTKSTIWTDTISSGLVDLNISGPKTNPLAELGIDLKDSIFSAQEKRKEEKAQPTAGHMGRAMGSGTGLGLAGAGVIAPPPAPNMMGGGMGMGMGMAGMRQPSMGGMGMGSNAGFSMAPGMGTNPGYGAAPGMGMNPGYGVPPGMGMAPGMNPGMGGYGPGMGMPGGYGSGMGLGGYSGQQQYSGYR